jgi:tRNA(Ile)-lysidine synthase
MVGLLCSAGLAAPGAAVVAHFDHRLRGEGEARRDLAAVEELCARFELPLETGAWDAPRRGEAAAREARQRDRGAVAARASAAAVVSGESLVEEVETVMLNTLRGAGPYGLAGMAADAPWPLGGSGPRVLRPLLDVERAGTRVLRGAGLR